MELLFCGGRLVCDGSAPPWDLGDGGCSVEVSVNYLHFFNFYFKSWEAALLPLQEQWIDLPF